MTQLTVSDQITKLRQNICELAIASHRPPDSVKLLAVSKTRQLREVKAAVDAGQLAFGENYAQELVEKSRQIRQEAVDWHFIGPLQSNKAKLIAQHADWIHTIDRLKTAQRLNHQLQDTDKILQVCIQLNIDDETTKAGVALEQLGQLAEQLSQLDKLCLRGLMCIPKPETDHHKQRVAFAKVRAAQEQLIEHGYALDTLSMGMSNDYPAAIAEGATIVRVGTAIFGPRQ